MWRAINLIALTFLVSVGKSQTPIFTVQEHYDTEKGLPQGGVTAVTQDDNGFIWISTLDGLARFDGQEFLHYNSSLLDESYRLTSSRIHRIHYDKKGYLWILYFNAKVDCIDTETLKILRDIQSHRSIDYDDFQLQTKFPDYLDIVSDVQGNWFISSKKSYLLFDSLNIKLASLFSDFEKTTDQSYGFGEDKDGRLWVMTDQGLIRSDDTWKKYDSFPIPESLGFDEPSLLHQRPLVVQESSVLFLYEDIILVFDRAKQTYKKVQTPLVTTPRKPRGIRFFALNQNGHLFFEREGFVFRLEEDLSITTIWKLPQNEILRIDNIYIDRTNVLWVSTNGGGLYKVDMETEDFQSSVYKYNFMVDLLGVLGADTTAFPIKWKKKNGAYGLRYTYFDNQLVFSNEKYYGDDRLIYVYRNSNFEKIALPESSLEYIVGLATKGDSLYALDKSGNFFSWADIFKKPSQSKVIPVIVEKIQEGARMVSKPNISDIDLNDLESDGENLWAISTQNSLFQIRNGRLEETFNFDLLETSFVDILYVENAKGFLWIATLGGGLIKWNISQKKIEKTYTVKTGLPNNNVAFVVDDKRGYLWLGTFNGISQFDIETERFITYSTQDGLYESELNRHHILKLPDGRFGVGGTFGYSLFDPDLFSEDSIMTDVQISALQINDTPITKANFPKIDPAIIATKKRIDLSHSQNSLRIEIAAMQFNDPSSNHYRYQLVGFNDTWVDNEAQRVIRFDNLEPGNYVLKLNASNTDGVWSDQVNTLEISIAPPLWRTWWAYLVYFIAAFAIVFLYWRNYKQRLFEKQQLLFNEKEAKRLQEIDEIKSRFFSNITHEFRTPLTLILSPLEKYLREKEHPPELQKLLQNNYNQGSHLLNLVNQLLDISKLESGKMQVHKSVGDLCDFVRVSFDQFRPYAADKGIQMVFEDGGIHGNFVFEKVHWEKIVNNLLSNAIKFTETGQIKLSLFEKQSQTEKSTIQIKVQDSGIGIAPEQLEKLFDRFYQANDSESRDQEGTGIGLSLVKELTDLLQGKIHVESELGEGSTFSVELEAERVQEVAEEVELTEMIYDEALFLVVEDNAELRKFLVETLSEGRNVLSAKNGQEAWELIVEKLPDVIISDIMMPKMNGYELCEKVKGDIRTAHISFLLLTAKTAQESKERGLAFGADDYLTKPFHAHELELRIDNLIKQQSNLRNHLRVKLLSDQGSADLVNVGDEFVNQLYSFLEAHYAETDLDVAQIANFFAMSKSTLNRKLRSLLNVSANALIKQYRLQKAKELLKQGSSISQVCYAVGFESPSYFAQTFKEYYGKTPSEHLEQHS